MSWARRRLARVPVFVKCSCAREVGGGTSTTIPAPGPWRSRRGACSAPFECRRPTSPSNSARTQETKTVANRQLCEVGRQTGEFLDLGEFQLSHLLPWRDHPDCEAGQHWGLRLSSQIPCRQHVSPRTNQSEACLAASRLATLFYGGRGLNLIQRSIVCVVPCVHWKYR